MINDILYFVIGLAALVGGGELLVRSASRLAAAAGISSLVIGLTVVSLGTSAPELAVGAAGALGGKVDAGLGNIIGSNVFNILLVLGIVAFFASPAISRRSLRFDIPFMILSALATLLLAADHRISRIEAGLFFAAAVFYILANFYWANRESRFSDAAKGAAHSIPISHKRPKIPVEVGLLILGVFALGIGAHWVLSGATGFARSVGLSELAIGLTLIALGTSVPELVTSLVAIRRGEKDMAIGNIVGSCIFNLLIVMPVMAAFSGDGLHVAPEAASFDIPVMVASAIATVPLALSGYRVSRAEGVGLVLAYFGYIVALAVKSHVTEAAIR